VGQISVAFPPFAKPYLTLKEAEFDKQLATYS